VLLNDMLAQVKELNNVWRSTINVL
jgi:hypothetical protein